VKYRLTVTYLLRRLMVSVPILLGITVIVFFIASKMPGDAVLAMVSTDSPQAEDLIKPRRGQLGLDPRQGPARDLDHHAAHPAQRADPGRHRDRAVICWCCSAAR
jgi:ABC-type microcin C transport system permease subunit YejB